MRRTTTIDTTFPDGIGGRVVVHVRGRDLYTDAAGGAEAMDQLELVLDIDPWTATIVGLDVIHASARLDALLGLPLRGFRRRLSDHLADEAATRSLCFSALEDLGGAYLVSGYASLREGLIEATPEHAELAVQTQGDVCIGWAIDGPVLEAIRTTTQHPVPIGPAAPALDRDDPLGWHAAPPLVPPSVRRRRRTDVPEVLATDGSLRGEHHFRDSYATIDGEQVMHEYLVDATFDQRRRLVAIDVDARVLPWNECPGAIGTAQRLLGVTLGELADRVTTTFAGATTCTHLNSTLRVLADVRALNRSRG